MLTLTALVLLVPLVDQAVKVWLRLRLAERPVSLGTWGSLRLVESRVWLQRLPQPLRPGWLWIGWSLAAAVLVWGAVALLPASQWWCAGLLLGGSLSHLLETACRGRVTDYVCLRFWPAFNLADAAVVVGTSGLVVACLGLIREAAI